MGNKLCKKKTDAVDHPKSPTPFDRIITRLHLRPSSWKSESELNKKQTSKSFPGKIFTKQPKQRPLSKSCDWTDADLRVPESVDEPVHLKNPKLSLIFNDNHTPTPPPRKHRNGIREKFEAVARSSLQALQSKKPVEEPLCVKKTIQYGCPLDDHDHKTHNRDHKHEKQEEKKNEKQALKEMKRRKNLSVVSLPNYSELKLTVAKTDGDDDNKPKPHNGIHHSALSLTGESKTLMTRCRSFGSLLPQHLLHKLKTNKTPVNVKSDDSFGPLEDWDLRIIEHYNPKDASLPRPRKPLVKERKEVVSDMESLIVSNEEAEKPVAPKRSESLLKKMNKKAAEREVVRKSVEMSNMVPFRGEDRPNSSTPPPSPMEAKNEQKFIPINFPILSDESKVEHSNLLKLLEDFSILDKQSSFELEQESFPYIEENVPEVTSDDSSLTPSLVEFEKTLVTAVEEFINMERACGGKERQINKLGNLSLPQNAIATKT